MHYLIDVSRGHPLSSLSHSLSLSLSLSYLHFITVFDNPTSPNRLMCSYLTSCLLCIFSITFFYLCASLRFLRSSLSLVLTWCLIFENTQFPYIRICIPYVRLFSKLHIHKGKYLLLLLIGSEEGFTMWNFMFLPFN